MSQSDNKKNLFHNHLLSGWSKIFGKNVEQSSEKTEVDNTKKKPFPQNHFFSVEELSFLSINQKQHTLLERWALEMSLWAKERCNDTDKHNSKFFPAVQWQDGLLSTWINSKPYAEDLDQQADRLYQLQLAGYELSEAYIRMIDARSCRTLVGSLFIDNRKDNETSHNKNRYMRVKEVIDKDREPLSLCVSFYDKISHHPSSEDYITYKKLKTLIDTKNFTVLSNEALHKWNEEATVRDEVEKKYLSLIGMIKRANHLQGMFPVNNSIYVNLGGKTYYPKAWSLYDNKIRIDFNLDTQQVQAYIIENDESYLFVDALNYIEKTLNERTVTNDLASMVRIFGNAINENGAYVLLSIEKSLCSIDGMEINRVAVNASNEVIASNTESNIATTLISSDKDTLLRSIVEYCDSLINEYKRVQSKSTDKIVKELLQAKLNTISEGLSVYCKTTEKQPLDTLWQSVLTRLGIVPSPSSEAAVSSANVVQAEASSVHKESLKEPTDKPAVKVEQPAAAPLEASSPLITEQERSSTGSSNSSMSSSEEAETFSKEESISIPQGYIQVQPSPTGRWHTEEMQRREAYRVYGMLLSKKLKRQLDNGDNPWVSKLMMLPRDTEGKVYTGTNAIMLALWMEEKGFELPFFITEGELLDKGYGISEEAESLYILKEAGTERVYNISQTTFPINQRRAYESLKLNMVALERKKISGYQFLDANDFSKIELKHDGTPGLSLYDHTSKVIHIASKDKYENGDDYYRDLAVAMIESTRDIDFDTLCFDSYLFENLVSHLGSGIISQSCRFDATNPEYSKIWRERLENNPNYTKRILEQSETSSSQILQLSLS